MNGIEYRDNKLAGEIKSMMCFAWESTTKYPYFSQWGELNVNDVNDIIWRVLSHKQSIHDAILYVVGPTLDQKTLDILEEEDMYVTHYAGDFDVQWYSPAGEDFHMNVDAESFLSDFMFQAESFDVDEHVELWVESRGKRGVPNTIREIVEDSEAIKKKLLHVAERINKLRTPTTYECDYDSVKVGFSSSQAQKEFLKAAKDTNGGIDEITTFVET